ncbi:MAG: SlyX family protein [Magnetospirillum sp.]|nr:MAG: SlyX family protein [Magnetospirillum sp.]
MSTTGDDALEDRLIALEIRLAHHEHMADEMSDVLADQSRTIDMLTAQLRRLRERLEELRVEGEGSPQDDKPPPHY